MTYKGWYAIKINQPTNQPTNILLAIKSINRSLNHLIYVYQSEFFYL